MARIAIAGLQHETNTFASSQTKLTHFVRQGAWPAMTRANDIFEVSKGLNIPILVFIVNCHHKIEPIIWAMAEPGGYASKDDFEAIFSELVEEIVLLSPD